MESLYVSFFKRKWISSGLLNGPFIPLYGFGCLILIALSPYLKDSILLTFFVGGTCMTILEYFTACYIERIFHTQCWDYSHHRFHYKGRISLFYFLVWCSLSVLFIHYIHPFFMSLKLNNDFCTLISLIYCIFILKAFNDRLNRTQINGLDIS